MPLPRVRFDSAKDAPSDRYRAVPTAEDARRLSRILMLRGYITRIMECKRHLRVYFW